jgi:hypothetical protein
MEGNNDFGIPGLIGNPALDVTAEQMIQAHRQIIDRAHALGLRIYGGTLNPIEGIAFPNFYSAALEVEAPGRECVDPHQQGLRCRH